MELIYCFLPATYEQTGYWCLGSMMLPQQVTRSIDYQAYRDRPLRAGMTKKSSITNWSKLITNKNRGN
uniref:Uncharacterized protein n=1 Tax=Solanum lycopersicum TaxID=4081 RepID=A0A3Q7HBY6_SOLLC